MRISDWSSDVCSSDLKQLLGTYQGILQVDAWQAYDQFGKDAGANAGVEKSYCWAHLRRKFMDAGSDAPIAQDALQRIARIYSIETEVRGYPAESGLAVRKERSRPLVDKLHAWFVATNPSIMAGSATSYATDRKSNRLNSPQQNEDST